MADEKTKPTNPTYIHGVGSSVAIDTASEIVDLAGLDCSSLIGGPFTWEHKNDQPNQLVGKILEYKKIFSEADCENEHHKYFWDKCKNPYLYVMGRLFDDKKDSSRECAALFLDDAEHPDEHPMVGFSVEGSKISKNGLIVDKSIARKITVTNCPANKQCVAEMVSAEPAKADPDSIFKSEPSFCIELLEKAEKSIKATIASGTPASERPHGKVQYNVRKPTKHWAKPQSESKKFFKQKPKAENRESNFAQGGSGSASSAHKKKSNPLTPTFTHDRRIEAIPHRSMRKNEEMKKSSTLPPNWKASSTKHSQLGSVVSFTHPEHGTVTVHKDPATGMHEVKHAGKTAGLMGQKGSFAKPKEALGHAMKYVGALHSGKVLGRETANMSSDPNMQNKSEVIAKAMTAGSGMASPGNLSGGAVLGKESLDKKMKKSLSSKSGIHQPTQRSGQDQKGGQSRMGTQVRAGNYGTAKAVARATIQGARNIKPKLDKSQNLQRAEQEYATWAKREEFEAFMAKSMPHLAKGQIAAIGQALCLSKSIKAEEKLKKMMPGLSLDSFVEKKEKK